MVYSHFAYLIACLLIGLTPCQKKSKLSVESLLNKIRVRLAPLNLPYFCVCLFGFNSKEEG